MTRPLTLSDDRRGYLEGGLVGLSCDECGALVRAKKNSAQHTSVQWSVQAVDTCREFTARRAAGERTALVKTCGRLRDSIDRAVADGRLVVQS